MQTQAQYTNFDSFQPTMYSIFKANEMLKFLQSKGHTCSLDVGYCRLAKEQELDTDYRLRIYSGFTPNVYQYNDIDMIIGSLKNFIDKQGYHYE